MKRYIIILTILSAVILSLQGQTDTIRFTLGECIDYAFANSYDRQSMEVNVRQQEETLRGAKLAYAPSISASIGENLNHQGTSDNVNFGGSANIGANLTLYNYNTLRNIEQQKIMLRQTQYQNEQYDQNLVINIIREYVTVIGEMELIKYQEKIVSTSEQQVTEGEKKYRLGAILESDYLLLEAQHATNETNLLDSKNSLENSLLELKILMSMDPTKPLALELPSDETIEGLKTLPSRDFAIEQGLKNMPSMHLTETSLELARQGLKVAKGGYVPTIGANAQIGTSHNNFENFGEQLKNSFSQSVGISVSIPIYDRSQTETQVRKAKLSIQQAEFDKQQTELDVKNTMVQAYTNVETSLAKYNSTTKKYQAWQKTLDAYNNKFRLGAITTVDLLQQENNYISALNEYIQAKYKFMMEREVLNVYMGE